MAKKKGLASLVKAPRNTTINGQPHMLAYITGSEADALKRLGGSGDPGPMGIPSFFLDEGQEAFSESMSSSNFSSGPPDDGSRGGQESNRSTGSSSSSGTESDSGAGTSLSAFGGAGPSIDDLKEGKATTGPLGIQDGDPYYAYRDRTDRAEAITNLQRDMGSGNLPGLAGKALNFLGDINRKAMIDALERGGVPTNVTSADGTSFTRYVTMPDGRIVGTGPSPMGDGGDSGLASIAGGSGTLQAGEAATPAVTPDSYYQRGVGIQTMDLADAAQRDAFLAGLYGTTPSPIGSRLDREKGLLYLPDGTVVDIKTGKKIKERRISGLDIFKPLQTYA
jgi:hypothetical protein